MKRKMIFLAALCVMSVMSTLPQQVSADVAPHAIDITAKKFEFSPNHLTLKKGETVTLHLTSLDRMHGFFQRALGIDADIAPGKVSEVTLTPTTPGTYQVICDHYCGYGHGNMNMTIDVE
ncbi:MAG TPA: cupredoxin domain-containing protein [Candidatus Binataceae bacterium]|nr:cupredoxin domain-containing protein [Candidatus Binataceae bacterium]